MEKRSKNENETGTENRTWTENGTGTEMRTITGMEKGTETVGNSTGKVWNWTGT